MRRRFLSPWAVMLLVLALVLVAAAGCGGDKSSEKGAAATDQGDGKSAEQIVKDSAAKSADVKSASFTADMGLEIQGDASKMTDETAKAMLSQGVTMHAEGKMAVDPSTADATISVSFAGQNLDFGMMTQGAKAWVQYQDTWYKLDAKNAKAVDEQMSGSVDPSAKLKELGLDPEQWGTTYELVGTEDLNGVQVNHVKATIDPQKLAEALVKVAEDPETQKKLGASSTEVEQAAQSLQENKEDIEKLGKMLKDATIDYWIGVDDSLPYKLEVAGALDTTGQEDMEGVEGMTLKATMTMADYDQPVEVTPPAKSKSFEELSTQLFGGMMGGTGTGL